MPCIHVLHSNVFDQSIGLALALTQTTGLDGQDDRRREENVGLFEYQWFLLIFTIGSQLAVRARIKQSLYSKFEV